MKRTGLIFSLMFLSLILYFTSVYATEADYEIESCPKCHNNELIYSLDEPFSLIYGNAKIKFYSIHLCRHRLTTDVSCEMTTDGTSVLVQWYGSESDIELIPLEEYLAAYDNVYLISVISQVNTYRFWDTMHTVYSNESSYREVQYASPLFDDDPLCSRKLNYEIRIRRYTKDSMEEKVYSIDLFDEALDFFDEVQPERVLCV